MYYLVCMIHTGRGGSSINILVLLSSTPVFPLWLRLAAGGCPFSLGWLRVERSPFIPTLLLIPGIFYGQFACLLCGWCSSDLSMHLRLPFRPLFTPRIQWNPCSFCVPLFRACLSVFSYTGTEVTFCTRTWRHEWALLREKPGTSY